MISTLPITQRDFDDPMAFIGSSLGCLKNYRGLVTVRQFLSHVQCLAAKLPDNKYAINLCNNRYLFMVSFCAVLLRKQTNLLPPNKNTATQVKLGSIYGNSYALHDGGTEIANSASALNIEETILNGHMNVGAVPAIASEQLAAISFTSGSTGDSKPNLKYWSGLTTSSDINCKHMLPESKETLFLVATVPPQHMWGLETSVFLPLQHNVCVFDSRPFYPADVVGDLQSLPSPRCLVTTPVHLRSVLGANLGFPCVDLILCATSPLSQLLAIDAEHNFRGELREVYGCSEVGSMAVRKTANESSWQLFEGIHFKSDGEQTIAKAAHLPSEIILQDQIEFLGESKFHLKGRSDDMVDIAGKRGSLLEINQVLQNFTGLSDGVIFKPPEIKSSGITRLAAIVALKPSADKDTLKQYFRQYLDSAFIPRPILVVDQIDREENGKLPKSKVYAQYYSLIDS